MLSTDIKVIARSKQPAGTIAVGGMEVASPRQFAAREDG